MSLRLDAAQDTFQNAHVTFIEKEKRMKMVIGDGEDVGKVRTDQIY